MIHIYKSYFNIIIKSISQIPFKFISPISVFFVHKCYNLLPVTQRFFDDIDLSTENIDIDK